MHGKPYQASLVALMVALLMAVSFLQSGLNADRERLGFTRVAPLENMPPLLAFTTQALGGFRGLIANVLWIRANDLQENDKFFEMMQLADWITKLEPYFAQVWAIEAWNMAYNISVKFKDAPDRWRWVKAGMELLRDDGLRYNPTEPLIYRELGWIFQHKMGANLDDAHMYYKQAWLKEMSQFIGIKGADWDALLNPKTDEQRETVRLLREKYKMDPALMKQLDEKYGPLEWRLPEASAVYWASVGLKNAKGADLMPLRRVVYQSMQLSFYRGKLTPNPLTRTFDFGPNLEIFPKVSQSYEEQYAAEPEAGMKAGIAKAHRNVIRDAIYFYYSANRLKEAQRWFDYLAQHYPNDHMLNGKTNSVPRNITLDDYAFERIQEDVGETSPDRVKAIIEGMLEKHFYDLAIDEDTMAEAGLLLVRKVHNRYTASTRGSEVRIALPAFEVIYNSVLSQVLDPEQGFIPAMRAVLRTKLNLPAPEAVPGVSSSTNLVNQVPANETNSVAPPR